MQRKKNQQLENLKKRIKLEIALEYRSIEEFCYSTDISKSILSKLFSDKQKDVMASTLFRIAKALDGKIDFIKNDT